MAVAYGRQVYAVLFSGGWIGIGSPIRIGAGVDIAEVIMSDCSRESRFIGGGRIGLIELS